MKITYLALLPTLALAASIPRDSRMEARAPEPVPQAATAVPSPQVGAVTTINPGTAANINPTTNPGVTGPFTPAKSPAAVANQVVSTVPASALTALQQACDDWSTDTGIVSNFLNIGAGTAAGTAFNGAANLAFLAEVDELNHKVR